MAVAPLLNSSASVALIRARNPDVIAVQEIISTGEAEAGTAGRLISTTQGQDPGRDGGAASAGRGSRPELELGGQPAVAEGGIIHHTGLLWRDGIEAVPGTLQPLTRDGAGMWHCAIAGVFDFGGPKARIGSVQLSPFDRPGLGDPGTATRRLARGRRRFDCSKPVLECAIFALGSISSLMGEPAR